MVPTSERSEGLTGADWRSAVEALHAVGEGGFGPEAFARRGVRTLPQLVPSELTTLSVCDLDSGHRSVVSDQPGAISGREIEAFDRYFHDHPLVREHGRNPGAVTRRIGDLLGPSEFRRTPLFADYYRPIGISHVMAVPIHVDRRLLVSFVFNRSGRDFSDRERALLEAIRPLLGSFYRLLRAAAAEPAANLPLTARERDVMRWLAAGKTDKDIAELLAISPRTVHKHLQRIYEKLGVETRTAAVMRAYPRG